MSLRPVEPFYGPSDILVEEIGVYLGRIDTGVTELLLDQAEVVATGLVKVRPIGMAEAMDGIMLADSGALEAILKRLLKGAFGDCPSIGPSEDVGFSVHNLAGGGLSLQKRQTSLFELQAKMDDACFPALAHPDDEGRISVADTEIAESEMRHFTDAQAALEAEFDHEPVSAAQISPFGMIGNLIVFTVPTQSPNLRDAEILALVDDPGGSFRGFHGNRALEFTFRQFGEPGENRHRTNEITMTISNSDREPTKNEPKRIQDAGMRPGRPTRFGLGNHGITG